MRAGVLAIAGLLALCLASPVAHAQAPACVKADFEAVVDEAAGALRDLARENTPHFQAKLRQLKQKRGWSDDRFLKEAEPMVRDDKITAYDRTSEDLLDRITSAGQAGSAGAAPDCALLTELHGTMKVLVETQKAKWTYMFDKIEGELRK
jgi:hypothetical protein